MHSDIAIVEARPRAIAVVRVTTVLSLWPKQFMNTLDIVYDAVRAGRLQQSGQNVMVYRPRSDGRVDIECGIEVAATFDGLGEVVHCETPAGRAVGAAHRPVREAG